MGKLKIMGKQKPPGGIPLGDFCFPKSWENNGKTKISYICSGIPGGFSITVQVTIFHNDFTSHSQVLQ